MLHVEVEGGQARLFVESSDPDRLDALAAEPALGFAVSQLPLEEIFIAMVRRTTDGRAPLPRPPEPPSPVAQPLP